MESTKLQKQLEREQADHREAGRRVQSIAGQLTEALRKEDTRRKILAGSWALELSQKDEDFHARMMRELSRSWLVRDDDRQLFGLQLLSEEEKQRRETRRAPGRPRKKRGAEDVTSSASANDSSAADGTSAADMRETEAA